ncbi:MAG: hypothetical protein ACRD4K_15880 [Candidatus Acidiferrales bacterium]
MNFRIIVMLCTTAAAAVAPAAVARHAHNSRSAGGAASPADRHPAGSDSPALRRTFTAGSTMQYRVQVSVRTEIEGQQPETIGAKTFIHPFTRTAERRMAWRSTIHTLSVTPEDSAEIEETLNDFSSSASDASPSTDAEEAKLTQALEEMSADLTRPETRIFQYRELPSGQLLGLDSAGVPAMIEASPPLLSLWLLRALRPAAALPSRSITIGDHWQEPRAVTLAGWSEIKGTENGEWLEPAHALNSSGETEPSVRLLIVQQIQGKISDGPEKPPEGAADGRFHAESLATLSLTDGRVLAATRSATREITWTLAPVAGLDRPPEFHARLSVQIEIEECHGPCSSTDVRAGN